MKPIKRNKPKSKSQTERISHNDKRLQNLANQALRKADQHKDKLSGVWVDLKVLIRLLKAWSNRKYRVVPWKSILTVTAALLYFMNPFDLIPDFLLFGFLDDALVIAKVLSSLKEDLAQFIIWEKTIEVGP